MRGLLFAICALSTAHVAPAIAQDDGWPEGSAMHTGGLEVKRRDAATAVLARLEKRLLALISEQDPSSNSIPRNERLIAALKAQQAAWARYRVDECELAGALTGSGGSWPSTYAVRCEANLTELRVRRTRSAIRCVERITPSKRRPDESQCLYQLMPLAVPLRP
jgi:uncharacterized protein YecT (DUF1311 family)